MSLELEMRGWVVQGIEKGRPVLCFLIRGGIVKDPHAMLQ